METHGDAELGHSPDLPCADGHHINVVAVHASNER
jgi:hypothetical protein